MTGAQRIRIFFAVMPSLAETMQLGESLPSPLPSPPGEGERFRINAQAMLPFLGERAGERANCFSAAAGLAFEYFSADRLQL